MTPEDRKALRAAIIGSGETRRDHYEIAESIEAAGFIRAGTAGVTLWRAAHFAERVRRHAEFLAPDEREDVAGLLAEVEAMATLLSGCPSERGVA